MISVMDFHDEIVATMLGAEYKDMPKREPTVEEVLQITVEMSRIKEVKFFYENLANNIPMDPDAVGLVSFSSRMVLVLSFPHIDPYAEILIPKAWVLANYFKDNRNPIVSDVNRSIVKFYALNGRYPDR